jgi:hypothetical protein
MEERAIETAERRAVRLYRAQNSIWLWLGLACIAAFVSYYVDPSTVAKSAIGRSLSGPVDEIWNGGFLISGLLIIVGVWTTRAKIEIIGQLFLCASIATDSAAIAILAGVGPSFWTIAAIAIASVFRIYWLIHTTTPQEADHAAAAAVRPDSS